MIIGIPLGLQISRKENIFGLVAAVGLTLIHLALIIIIQGLSSKPELKPQFLIWLPNVALQLAGLYLLWKKR